MEYPKLTALDPNQITQYSFDENLRANRVVIVGDAPVFNTESHTLSDPIYIEKPVVVTQIEYKEIQVPHVIKEIEYKEIEKPYIVKEIEYREIVKEVPVERVVYKEIEKPIIVKETSFNDFPIWLKICFAIQTLAFILIAVKH